MHDIESERLERGTRIQEKKEEVQGIDFQLKATNNHKRQLEINVNSTNEKIYQIRYIALTSHQTFSIFLSDKGPTLGYTLLSVFSKNLVVYYCKCCNLIGYATRYLFVNRYRVAASNATRPSFSQKNNAYFSLFEIILKK